MNDEPQKLQLDLEARLGFMDELISGEVRERLLSDKGAVLSNFLGLIEADLSAFLNNVLEKTIEVTEEEEMDGEVDSLKKEIDRFLEFVIEFERILTMSGSDEFLENNLSELNKRYIALISKLANEVEFEYITRSSLVEIFNVFEQSLRENLSEALVACDQELDKDASRYLAYRVIMEGRRFFDRINSQFRVPVSKEVIEIFAALDPIARWAHLVKERIANTNVVRLEDRTSLVPEASLEEIKEFLRLNLDKIYYLSAKYPGDSFTVDEAPDSSDPDEMLRFIIGIVRKGNYLAEFSDSARAVGEGRLIVRAV